MAKHCGLTTKEIAEIFGITVNTAKLWLKNGKIKGQKIGRDWRVDPLELKGLITPGMIVGFCEATDGMQELAKKLYPEEWQKMQDDEAAFIQEREEEMILNNIRRPYSEEIALRFPYPYDDDEVVFVAEDGQEWCADEPEVYWGYYEDKLKEEQKKFDKLFEMLQKKYNIHQRELDEVKRTAENILLFRLAGYKGGDESV